jgi:hypothetical protein
VATPSRQKVRRPNSVTLADGSKEFVGRERQASDGIDLVHENDKRPRLPRENAVADGGEEALTGPQPVLGQPEFVEGILQMQLTRHLRQQAVIPLLRRDVLADCSQVEGDDLGGAFA